MWSKYKYKIYWVGLVTLHLQVFNAFLSLFCLLCLEKKKNRISFTIPFFFLFSFFSTLHYIIYNTIQYFLSFNR
jgi:hypothetical protein